MRTLTAVAVLVAASACGAPSVAGTWDGKISGSDQALSITIVENAGVVDGTGTLSYSGSSLALTVKGTWSSPMLTATITSGMHPAMNMAAELKPNDTLAAKLTGSGFNGETVDLTRKKP